MKTLTFLPMVCIPAALRGLAGTVATVFTVLFLSSPALAAQGVPSFGQFHVAPDFNGKRVPPVLATRDERGYRTRIREAAQEPPNFAGHFVLSTWGCGAACEMGVAVDLQSGTVAFLPGTVCCWFGPDPDARRIDFRPDSRLVILSGQLNEEGSNHARYYVFDGKRFTLRKSLPLADEQPARE